jgi:cell division protein FtsZ
MAEKPVPQAYVPQHAQRPTGGQRMPRTDELPNVGRRLVEADTADEDHHAMNAPRALFRRLASNVGLNLKQEVETKQADPGIERASAQHPAPTEDLDARNAIEQSSQRPQAQPQGAAGSLDPHGRTAPAKDGTSEHLEIPAFLRKHG